MAGKSLKERMVVDPLNDGLNPIDFFHISDFVTSVISRQSRRIAAGSMDGGP
jgi:hypothetical protein